MKQRLMTFGRLALLAVAMLTAACADDKTGGYPKTDPDAPTPVEDSDLKNWMFDYLKTSYLWNDALGQVTPDYTLDYDKFLTDILEQVAAQNDVNHDDGHWENGTRRYFYSNIQRYDKQSATASATRGTRETTEGSGITSVLIAWYDNTYRNYAFIMGGVAPTSPAGQAGLKRGDIVYRIDGEPIGTKETECMAALDRMTASDKAVTVSVADGSDGTLREVSYTAGSYDDNPVWKTAVVDRPNGVKVGYLCYNAFNYYYDDELLEALQTLKAAGIGELVLDLRYNGGGHVVSSVLLATAVAGEAHRNEVYLRMTYNDDRMAGPSKPDVYRLGASDYGSGTYDKIASALGASLGMSRVYVLCSTSTASASELIINGLRGVDIEVRLIGGRTNGKNVGMESITKEFGEYEYVFSPITFYSENAKGFRDYSDGFDPAVAASEGELPIADWGNPDDGLFSLALKWIDTGTQPEAPTRAAVAGGERIVLRVPHGSPEGMIVGCPTSDR